MFTDLLHVTSSHFHRRGDLGTLDQGTSRSRSRSMPSNQAILDLIHLQLFIWDTWSLGITKGYYYLWYYTYIPSKGNKFNTILSRHIHRSSIWIILIFEFPVGRGGCVMYGLGLVGNRWVSMFWKDVFFLGEFNKWYFLASVTNLLRTRKWMWYSNIVFWRHIWPFSGVGMLFGKSSLHLST